MRNPGDKVSVDHPKYPGIWTIKSIGPKNTVLEPQGGGRGLRVPHYMIVDPVDGVTVTAVPLPEYYEPGEFVRLTGGKYAGLYVVLADKGEKVNVTKPGGDGGRYIRAPKGRNIERVPASEVMR